MTNFVNISVSQNAQYFITSTDGKQIQTGELYVGKNHLNTDELNSGIYIINVKTTNGFKTYKIIKQ